MIEGPKLSNFKIRGTSFAKWWK